MALESNLGRKEKDFQRLQALFRDEQAEWDLERSRLKKESVILKATQKQCESGAAMMLRSLQDDSDQVLKRERRLLAYLKIFESTSDRRWSAHLLKTPYMALRCHARRRAHMWNLATVFIRLHDIREAEYVVGKWYDVWKEHHTRVRQTRVSVLAGGNGADNTAGKCFLVHAGKGVEIPSSMTTE